MNPSMVMSALQSMGQRPIAYYPACARITGSVKAGVFLSQLMYWAPRGKSKWHYKTMADWQKETCLTRSETESARRKCLELGLVEERLQGLPARMHYRLDWQKLAELLAGDQPDSTQDTCELDGEKPAYITETPTESPAKNPIPPPSPPWGGERAAKKQLTEADIETLVAEFGPRIGGERRARDAIEMAMAHTARKKYPDNPGLYLRGWLRRDAERYEREMGNGRAGTHGKGSSGGDSESDDRERYAEFRAF